jgi:hypothetical protein
VNGYSVRFQAKEWKALVYLDFRVSGLCTSFGIRTGFFRSLGEQVETDLLGWVRVRKMPIIFVFFFLEMLISLTFARQESVISEI